MTSKNCPTRWTVHASCFQQILDNYSALQEWIVCLDEKLQPDNLLASLTENLRLHLFSRTGNLLKTLQMTMICTVSGLWIANSTK